MCFAGCVDIVRSQHLERIHSRVSETCHSYGRKQRDPTSKKEATAFRCLQAADRVDRAFYRYLSRVCSALSNTQLVTMSENCCSLCFCYKEIYSVYIWENTSHYRVHVHIIHI